MHDKGIRRVDQVRAEPDIQPDGGQELTPLSLPVCMSRWRNLETNLGEEICYHSSIRGSGHHRVASGSSSAWSSRYLDCHIRGKLPLRLLCDVPGRELCIDSCFP